MSRSIPKLASLAVLLVAASAALIAGAGEPQAGPTPAAASATASTEDALDQPHGRSKQQTLLDDPLHAVPGKQAHLLRIEYPAGWVGRRHYHTGDVILYVLEGGFVVDVEGGKRTTIRAGETYHEAVHNVMQARNASATQPTKLLLFQVGAPGERLTVTVD